MSTRSAVPAEPAAAAAEGSWLAQQLRALRGLRGEAAERAFWLGIGFTAVVTGLHVLNALTIDGWFFDMDESYNFPSAASSLLFAIGGVTAWRAAGETDSREARRVWIGVTVIMALFAIEAMADLHAKAEEIDGAHTIVLLSYPVIGGLVLVLLLPPLLRMAPPVPLLLIGAAVLIVGSQALSAYNNSAEIGGALGRFLDILEEDLEMVAPCLAIAAALHASVVTRARAPAAGD